MELHKVQGTVKVPRTTVEFWPTELYHTSRLNWHEVKRPYSVVVPGIIVELRIGLSIGLAGRAARGRKDTVTR